MAPPSSMALIAIVVAALATEAVAESLRIFERVESGTCGGEVVLSTSVEGEGVCAMLCHGQGPRCEAFTVSADGECRTYKNVTHEADSATAGLMCYRDKASTEPTATTISPTTTTASPTTTTPPPVLKGLHPEITWRCTADFKAVGAYTIEEGNQVYHYLLCAGTPTPFHRMTTGSSVDRQATCGGSFPVYVGFISGTGPCAPLYAWSVTTNCRAGDTLGDTPADLPADHLQYLGCRGALNEEDFALTEYKTVVVNGREILDSIKCCQVVQT